MYWKKDLTSGEWTNALKQPMNSMAYGGKGSRNEGNRCCRHLVCNENTIIETLSRIRGVCPKTESLRNATHKKIRLTLVNLLSMKKLLGVYEEIRCQAMVNLKTQNRRTDIIVIERKKNQGFVFDSTM